MDCPRCQAANDAGARFCEECGAGLEIACSRCGSIVAAGKNFCRSCGAAVAGPLRSLEKAFASQIALEGERKQVTILFADLKGSMELIADLDPEEARGILDPVLQLMMEAVHRYEGTVSQVMGDGIMALFGAPLAQENHAVRACYAALQMQESARKHVAGKGLQALQFRVGLNSGEVVVRSVGSDLRMDYTAVGQATHIAARMEQLATPNAIFISAATFALAGGFIEARALGPLSVKGLSRPTHAYELLAARTGRTRFDVLVERGLTPFIGRAAEMDQLRRAYAAAAAGAGSAVSVIGEPGIGKSRLLREFARADLLPSPLILGTGCVSYGETNAYLPLVELLQRYFQIESRDSRAVVQDKVCKAVERLGLPRAAAMPPLLWLLGAGLEEGDWHRLEPSQRRRLALEAARDLFLQASRAEPLVVVIEDLQWIDAETRSLLDMLVENLASSRILLLVSTRPGYAHGWDGKPVHSELPMLRLPAADAEELLHALTGRSDSLRSLKQALIQRGDGNAFFLEESVRTLAETEVLSGAPGDYFAREDAGAVQIPASVYAVLAARIDRQSAPDKRLLQAASAIGSDVPSVLLEAIADVSPDEYRGSVARLQAAGFLQAMHLYPEIRYSFRHALTCDVAYQSLVLDRRRALHVRIVAAIERVYADTVSEQAESLAHHALRGEFWPKALRYCRDAGLRALARSANRAAVTHFERALEAVGHLGNGRDAVEAAIDLRLDCRNALGPLGEHKRMFEALAQAEQLAGELGDRRRLGLVVSFLSNLFAMRGEFEKAVEHGRRALAIGEELDDLPVRVVSNGVLAITHWARGEFRHAVEHAGWNVQVLVGERRFDRLGMAQLPAVYSRTSMAVSLAELGEFDRSSNLGADALAIAESAAHPQSVISACFGLGSALARRGEFDRAIAVLERGRDVAEAAALPAALLELVPPLASAYSRSSRTAEAVDLVKQAVARATALRNPLGHWIRSGGLGEAYFCAGRLAEALPMARLYVDVTRTVGARGNEAWALLLLGEVQAGHDGAECEQAERTLDAALELARALEMRPLEARSLLARGGLYHRRGEPKRAAADLAAAAEAFRSLGMEFWLARAENMLGESKGPAIGTSM